MSEEFPTRGQPDVEKGHKKRRRRWLNELSLFTVIVILAAFIAAMLLIYFVAR